MKKMLKLLLRGIVLLSIFFLFMVIVYVGEEYKRLEMKKTLLRRKIHDLELNKRDILFTMEKSDIKFSPKVLKMGFADSPL